jgi:AcrR family transcriptional regulator
LSKPDGYHHGNLRADLVEAVRRLVEERGPDRFSVADACRIAGVSTAAPYRHFADKEEILLEVAVEGIRRQRAALQAAVAGRPPGTDDTLQRLGMAYVGFARAEPAVFRLIFGLTRTHRDNDAIKTEGMQTYGVLLDQVQQRLGAAGRTDEVLRRSFPLWTLVHGLSFLLIDDKLSTLNLDIDLPAMVGASLRRLLAD